MTYDQHYQNEQAFSTAFKNHLETVAALIGIYLGRKNLVEVGCGKGFFLEMLLSKGFEITGFDPAYQGANNRIAKTYFQPGIIQRANGLILRHVLEHVPNPFDFLNKLKTANGGRGKIYIEVPCFDWICKTRAWFDIYYEHVNYFRLRDFHRLFGHVVKSGRLFGDQYLYVIADLATLRYPKIDDGDRVVHFPPDFTDGILTRKGKEELAAIWGGASKGVIFSLLKARAGQPVDIVIDINPAKQGKYLPATGLLVRPPEEALRLLKPGSTICVMNSNYIEEVRYLTDNRFNLVGVNNE
jgi:SAM-dependent methyltransferase